MGKCWICGEDVWVSPGQIRLIGQQRDKFGEMKQVVDHKKCRVLLKKRKIEPVKI